MAPPFSMSRTSTIFLKPNTPINFTNETLNVAINNKEAFYELYVAVLNRAIDLYAKSGRRKFALKLHGNLAALELYACIHLDDLNAFVDMIIQASWKPWSCSYNLHITTCPLCASHVDFLRIVHAIPCTGHL